ncbi:MFS transporter [Streptomyces sp. NPDC047017]|uniref:MFS transporter n=1 Tax=Streptomyces sp. NPDC047017 TaxID=3155024 RepID=UPI00340E6AEA
MDNPQQIRPPQDRAPQDRTEGTAGAPDGPARQEAPAAPRGRWGHLLVCWLIEFAIGTDLFVISPLLPRIAESYEMRAADLGAVVTAFSVAYIVGAPLIGSVADRVDRRLVLVGGLLLFTVANLATAFAPNYPVLLLTRVLAGLASGAANPAVYAATAVMAPDAKRGRWLAVVSSGLLSSLALGASIGSALGRGVGWRPVFVGIAVLTLLLGAAAWAVMPAMPGQAGERSRLPLGAALRAVSVTAVWALAVYLLYTFLGVALDARGQGGSTPWVLVVYGVGAVAGGLLGGQLTDRWGAGRTLTTVLLCMAAMELAVCGLFHTGNVMLLAAGLAVFAVCTYAMFAPQQGRVVSLFPRNATAVLAWNNSALFVGAGLAGAVGGPLLNALSYGWLLVFGAVLAAGAAALSRA